MTVAQNVQIWVTFKVYPPEFGTDRNNLISLDILIRYGARQVFHADGTSRIYFRGEGDADFRIAK